MTRKRLTKRQRSDVLALSGGRCHITGRPIRSGIDAWEVEHPVPIALGGPDTPENRRAALVDPHREKTKADRMTLSSADEAAIERSWFVYGGFAYVEEIDEDDDRRKIDHFALNVVTGERILIDLSPYEQMSLGVFKAAVDLGFPRRTGIAPFRGADLIRMRDELARMAAE